MAVCFDDSNIFSTSVNVAVRLRPFTQDERANERVKNCVFMTDNVVHVKNHLEFIFDHCIKPHHDNRYLYARVGHPLLQHALDGYSVCMFAFGQTGSGKTHSIMGPDDDPGLIKLFVMNLFDRIKRYSCAEIDTQFKIECSYYEIYNEKIHDLLGNDPKAVLRVREHPTNGPYIVDLSTIQCTSYIDTLNWIKLGQKRRNQSATALNKNSSRSHTIFTLTITQDKQLDNEFKQSITSKVNIVDLAGSERSHVVNGATPQRIKESVMINKSLLTLGKVITQLAECDYLKGSNTFIPYRESVLTWLLKESLGGNSKTTMIATISPANIHEDETLSTLRYAATARRVVNILRVNEDPKVRRIRELMNEVETLKQRINLLESQKYCPSSPRERKKSFNSSSGKLPVMSSPIKVYPSADLLKFVDELFKDVLTDKRLENGTI
ncbi:Kinesin-like protein KIF14, partial [Fragariocoptes setiger]